MPRRAKAKAPKRPLPPGWAWVTWKGRRILLDGEGLIRAGDIPSKYRWLHLGETPLADTPPLPGMDSKVRYEKPTKIEWRNSADVLGSENTILGISLAVNHGENK